MRLGLSSEAAPDLPLEGLLEGCRRRGLSALELGMGDAHGVDPYAPPARSERLVRLAEEAGVRIAALSCRDPGESCARETLRLGARLGVPLLVPAPAEELPAAVLSELVRSTAEAGGRLLLLHGTDPGVAARLRRAVEAIPTGSAVGLAWEVDPERDDPGRAAEVLREAGPRLEHVRLRGGGPEAARQTGMGVGALMARLALARFAGPLVLTPSTPEYRRAWGAWLGRSGGWGCGSKQSDPDLVTLPLAAGGQPGGRS